MSEHHERGLDATGALELDIPCRECGYNLRGLAVSAKCPECMTPVAQSARGRYLRYSDPAWLATLHNSMIWLLVSLAAAVVTALLAGLVVSLSFRHTDPRMVSLIVGIAQFVPFAVGLILLTVREPGVAEQGLTVRRAIRAMLGVQLIAQGLVIATTPPTLGAQSVWQPAVSLAATGVLILVLVRLRRLAIRLPDPSLFRLTSAVMWGMTVIGILAAAMAPLMNHFLPGLTQPTPTFPSMGTMSLIMFVGGACVLGLAALTFGILYIVMLFKYRARFAVVHRDALAS